MESDWGGLASVNVALPRRGVADYTVGIRMAPPTGRILLIKPSALGDVCRSMPVLASLKAAFPDCPVDWLVQDDFTAIVQGHPAVDRVVDFPRRAWRRWWLPQAAKQIIAFRKMLGESGYTLAVDLQGLFRSGIFLRFTQASRRVGWSDAREFAWLGANQRHTRRGGPDATEVMLALLEDAGIAPIRDARIFLPVAAADVWRLRCAQMGIKNTYAVLAPTSRWISKRWPADRWRLLAQRVAALGMKVVMVGAPSEREQVRAAMPTLPQDDAIDLCGMLPLQEWMAALQGAAIVVANDSAALHAAVGFGRSAVGIYGATDPASVGPYQRAESVVAPPGMAPRDAHAYRDDRLAQRMHLISVDAVEKKLHQELQRGARW